MNLTRLESIELFDKAFDRHLGFDAMAAGSLIDCFANHRGFVEFTRYGRG